MSDKSIIRKVGTIGHIVIPKDIRTALDIQGNDLVELLADNDKLIIQKPQNACLVTGKISESNIPIANGKITLSEEGAKSLIEEIKLYVPL
ncbi:AbrB/MazE/SpoVT family DNA-binding domain-containing protein [Virgibacillus salexigens]|uniref:AbrB/MazE/SpoVT family DNA-binding domain-containing protein n=1 Tax=Virgibacillus massiliensis TaxID=1462526 RepID=UPI00136B4828|nr:AbrB/MazE/SpoVT family DNA-binding domain-containing protein [Virgibacillus massiliensis]MYL43908.1 AbrB/MazE/SpoVT family DNA-binding domain-containing protein [Virgibacillus massiliensis]